MFIKVLFITAHSPSTDEWINKLWYIHIADYYAAVKGNEVQTHATTWRTLERIMHVKEANHKRLHIMRFHLYEIRSIGKSTESEGQLVVARGWGAGVTGSDWYGAS